MPFQNQPPWLPTLFQQEHFCTPSRDECTEPQIKEIKYCCSSHGMHTYVSVIFSIIINRNRVSSILINCAKPFIFFLLFLLTKLDLVLLFFACNVPFIPFFNFVSLSLAFLLRLFLLRTTLRAYHLHFAAFNPQLFSLHLRKVRNKNVTKSISSKNMHLTHESMHRPVYFPSGSCH